MKKMTKVLITASAVLTAAMLCCFAVLFVAGGDDTADESVDIMFEQSAEAQQIYAEMTVVYVGDVDGDFEFTDGLTVIYGSDIDVESLFAGKSYDEVYAQKASVDTEEPSEDTAVSSDDTDVVAGSDEYEYTYTLNVSPADTAEGETVQSETNVYIVFCMQSGSRRDIEYVSVSYEADVDTDVIDAFVSAGLEDDALGHSIKEFICAQVEDEISAYNAGK